MNSKDGSSANMLFAKASFAIQQGLDAATQVGDTVALSAWMSMATVLSDYAKSTSIAFNPANRSFYAEFTSIKDAQANMDALSAAIKNGNGNANDLYAKASQNIQQGLDIAYSVGDTAAIAKWTSMANVLSSYSISASISPANRRFSSDFSMMKDTHTLLDQLQAAINGNNVTLANELFAKASLSIQKGAFAGGDAAASFYTMAKLLSEYSKSPNITLSPANKQLYSSLTSSMDAQAIMDGLSSAVNGNNVQMTNELFAKATIAIQKGMDAALAANDTAAIAKWSSMAAALSAYSSIPSISPSNRQVYASTMNMNDIQANINALSLGPSTIDQISKISLSIQQGIDAATAAGDLVALAKWTSMALTLAKNSPQSANVLMMKAAQANIDQMQYAITSGNGTLTNELYTKATLALQQGIDAATAAGDYVTLAKLSAMVDKLDKLALSSPLIVPSSQNSLSSLKGKLPVDCAVSAWSAWSNCTPNGSMTQTRSIVTPASNGGKACLPLSQNSNCPVPCAVSPWSSFGACSQSCGGGTQSQTRTISAPALYGGTSCPPLTNTQPCNSNACSVDCMVGPWTGWSACDTSGNFSQTRSILKQAADGGLACPPLKNSSNCPVSCQVSEWSPFSACTASCGGGTQSQSRVIVLPPLYGGTACPSLTNSQPCNMSPCPVNCVTGDWSAWSACSNGVTRRTMPILKEATNGGAACPITSLLSQSSNCPIDCVVGAWSSWSSCVNGTITHTRSIVTSPAYGGQVCPPLTEGSNCPVDCTTSAWSTCSTTCGGGTQTRTVVQPAMNGGLACPVLSQPCNTALCPVNCIGSWGIFGGCSKTCGSGTQSQTYAVSTPAANGGTACPVAQGATNTQTCNTGVCPVSQSQYTTPGTYTWVCPTGVTSVCAVAIGGGSSGCYYTGGAGGGLSFQNDIVVVPGQSYTVVVGAGGTGSGGSAGGGGNSSVFGLTAGGGGGGGNQLTGGRGTAGNGGNGVYGAGMGSYNVGGSGAGGYTSDGGVGSYISGSYIHGCGTGGGGVGIFGGSVGGTGGTAGYNQNGPYGSGGGGGSGGATGSIASWSTPGVGGLYGGGGGSGNGNGYTSSYGGGGAVRIIWGSNRAFPNTNTNNL